MAPTNWEASIGAGREDEGGLFRLDTKLVAASFVEQRKADREQT